MSDTVIRVEGVAKKFCRTVKHTMLYGATDLTNKFLGLNQKTSLLRSGEFWAVDDISFELKKGECLGVAGPNGSGKSTLLKMLNGIFLPDRGKIEIRGRVGALIEVGAGFHPMLTGRENIYINGAILGLSKKEIDRKFDKIVDFAEIGEFINSPVKHYSSGMHVRLGFAVAAHMDPDILLIDEVLAVGDLGFSAKCYNVIGKILNKAAVIFVSHQMPQVSRICSEICVMNKGKSVFQGKDVPKGIEHYYSNFEAEKNIITGSGKATIHYLELESNGNKGVDHVNYLDDLAINLQVSIDPSVRHPNISINFLNQALQIIAQCNSIFNKETISNTGKKSHLRIRIPSLSFNPGVYVISVLVSNDDRSEILTWHSAFKQFEVKGEHVGAAPVQLSAEWDFQAVS
jgi:lipopolysaccharide transport system ATP-binding protein